MSAKRENSVNRKGVPTSKHSSQQQSISSGEARPLQDLEWFLKRFVPGKLYQHSWMYWLLKMNYHSCLPSPDTHEQIAREPPKKCNTANQEKNGSRPHYGQQGQSCITNCVDMQRSLTRISTFRNRKVHRQNCLQQLRVFDLSDIIIYLLVSCTVLCCACSDAQPAFTPGLLAHAHSWSN